MIISYFATRLAHNTKRCQGFALVKRQLVLKAWSLDLVSDSSTKGSKHWQRFGPTLSGVLDRAFIQFGHETTPQNHYYL